MKKYAESLKANMYQPAHACRLVGSMGKAGIPLELLSRDARFPRGYGVQIKLNDRNLLLLLDTGASGILINRNAAERAGVERIAAVDILGIGDHGPQSGYLALANRIRIGKLEFQDCVVEVSDRSSIDNEEGLIGADVFSSYLIDIDGPNQSLRLSPLPKKPEEATSTTALSTDKEGTPLPEDRYVAPEMANWSKVFRFGHQLLIPTYVNDSPSMLFEIDSGSSFTMISATAARKITKTYRDNMMTVKGLNGNVNKV